MVDFNTIYSQSMTAMSEAVATCTITINDVKDALERFTAPIDVPYIPYPDFTYFSPYTSLSYVVKAFLKNVEKYHMQIRAALCPNRRVSHLILNEKKMQNP